MSRKVSEVRVNQEDRRSAFFASLRKIPRVAETPFGLSEISAKPEMDVLLTYRSTDLKIWHALGEFVDNAVTSFWDRIIENPSDPRFKQLKVDISWDSVAEVLTITDNAAGIPRTESGWGRALKTGVRNPNPNGLSVHGVGMKAAGLWWAPVIKIRSKYVEDDDEVFAVLDLDKMVETNSENIDLQITPARDKNAHGTTVTLEGLNRGRSYPVGRTLGKVRTFLASMYRSFLRGDEAFLHPGTGEKWLTLTVLGETLSYEDPAILNKPFWPSDRGPGENKESILWRREYSLSIPTDREEAGSDGVIVVSGWMGILAEMKRGSSGIFLTYNGKGVAGVEQGGESGDSPYKPAKLFGSVQGQRSGRLIGEFEVSQFGKSLTTDAVNWSPAEEEAFIDALLKEIKDPNFPIYQMANNFRIDERDSVSDAEVRRIEVAFEEATAESDAVIKSVGEDLWARTEPSDSKYVLDSLDPQELIRPDITFEIQDGKQARVSGIFARGEAWLNIYPNDPIDIVINLGHPFVSRFFRTPSSAEPIIHFAIAIAQAELSNPEFRALGARNHINRWLQEVGLKDFDVLRIDDYED